MTPMIESISALDDPKVWLREPLFEPPLPKHEIEAVQAGIDSIIGVTRDNKSIAKLAWSGDREFWFSYYTNWSATGKGVGELHKRPQLLYKSILGPKNEVIDIFPARWIILTRIEKEQYVPTWKRDTVRYCNIRKCNVQVQPETPPEEYWLWYMTIAFHTPFCCRLAHQKDERCYGTYCHPRKVLEDLRAVKKGLEIRGITQCDPFKTADELLIKIRRFENSNYDEQSLLLFAQEQEMMADEAPLYMATDLVQKQTPLSNIRQVAKDRANRAVEEKEKKLFGSNK